LSRPLYSKGEVVIEDDVWIGEMACIMPGVRIGRGTVIGAGAVVTKSMPPYCVVGGVPAVVIKNMSSK
jgi:acetyltransferase-like isoleucine patch superfamily enzyme